MKLRVKENERLVRDSANFAILNTDVNAVRLHEQKMERLRREKSKEQDINNLKRDVSEIKELLQVLIQSKNQ
jgi:hypothetical protein